MEQEKATGAITPDVRAIEQGLLTLRPQGGMTLLGFDPRVEHGGPRWTRLFNMPEDVKKAALAIETVNAAKSAGGQGFNVYWTVGLTRTPMDKKAAKTDMVLMPYAWADIDPPIKRFGGNYEAARNYLDEGMFPRLAAHATIIIDSGNGLQAFFRLYPPEDTDQGVNTFEVVNKRLGEACKAPGTFNADRIMRMPGTLNWRTPAKAKKGYPEAPSLARILFHGERTYTMPELEALVDKLELERRLAELLASNPEAARRWSGSAEGLTDHSGSAMDFSMCAYLKSTGFSLEQARQVLEGWPHGGKGRSQGDRYWARCWARGGINDAGRRLKPQRGAEVARALAGEHRFTDGESCGGPVPGIDEPAVIRCTASEIKRIEKEIEQALHDVGLYYENNRRIVRPATDRESGSQVIDAVELDCLRSDVSAIVNFEQYNNKEKRWKACAPPEPPLRALVKRGGYSLPYLRQIVRQPTLRADLTLMNIAGYDPASELFGAFDPAEFNIPDKPTMADAELELEKVLEPLGEFEFETPRARAAAVCAILCAVLRPGLPAAPGYLIRAHQVGSGKSTLGKSIALYTSPNLPAMLAYPNEPEEFRKQIIPLMEEGRPCVMWDNVVRDLQVYPEFATMLSESYIKGRPIGTARMPDVRANSLVLMTGNNISPTRDLIRRFMVIELTSSVDKPVLRKFKADPIAELQANRSRYVAAALTIVRAFIQAGMPGANELDALGYPQWTRLCRGPLVWLGLEDPGGEMLEALEADPEASELAAFMQAWRDEFGTSRVRPVEIVKRAQDSFPAPSELREILVSIVADAHGTISVKRLGTYLKLHEKAKCGKSYLVSTGAKDSRRYWRIVDMP